MLLPKQYATRWPLRLGLATLLVLLVFAWHFYMERAAYYDLAYHTFIYLKTKHLFVQNRRFVAIVTQLPTLLAIRAGLPLDGVLRLYSAVFILYYLGVFLVCAYWMRNEQVALVVALLYVLMVSRTFYWAQSELPQALAALLLFYGGIARQTPIRLNFSTLALAMLVPVFIFGHPLCILPFAFIWAYDWLLNRRFRDWGYYGLLVLGLVTYQVRAMLVPPGSYEATHMTFTPYLIKYFPNYLAIGSFDNFWQLCRDEFVALPILLVALSVFYLRQRTWLAALRLALVWGFVVGYVFIINVSNPDYTEATYLENLYMPLVLFVAIPFALELLPALERGWNGRGAALAAGVLVVGLCLRLGVVWYRHVPYTAYQQWLNHLLTYTRQFPERKYVMYPDNVDPYRLRAGWPWWASASETMMVSARHHPDSVQTIRVGWEVDQFMDEGSHPDVLLGPFEKMNASDLPAKYCRFPNTIYRKLNSQPPQDTAALGAYIAAHQQVSLALVGAAPTTFRAAHQQTLQVRVSVPTALQPLHSAYWGDHPTLLRTAFYKAHDWPSDTDPLGIALEVDVWQPWTQTIPVQVPRQPGRYTFEVSLTSKDYRDWPVRLRVPVEVVE
jgi:hypothetical protein